jgi:hypothetical protein
MDLIRGSVMKYVVALALVAAAIGAAVLIGCSVVAIFLGGYLLGMVVRDFQWVKSEMAVLPLTPEITNWERVEQLVRENETPGA